MNNLKKYKNICSKILMDGFYQSNKRGVIKTYDFNQMLMFRITDKDICYDDFKFIPKKLVEREYELIYNPCSMHGELSFLELEMGLINWYSNERFVKSPILYGSYSEQVKSKLTSLISNNFSPTSKNILFQFNQDISNMPICIESIQILSVKNKYKAICIQRSSDLSLGWFFNRIHIYKLCNEIVDILNKNAFSPTNTPIYHLSYVDWYIKHPHIYSENEKEHQRMLDESSIDNNYKSNKKYDFKLAQ